MQNWDYRLKELSRKPAVWAAGAVLTIAVLYAAFSGPPARRGAFLFPTNEGPLTARGDRGGLAPGRPYGAEDVGGSLGLAPGFDDSPGPAEAAAEKGDFIEALNEIAAEPPAKKPRKERGIIARMKSALSSWGGSSGSGSSAGLAAPSARALAKRGSGPGTMHQVDSSPDFRAVYQNSDPGAVRHSERGDGILAAAGEKAANVFKNLLPGSLADGKPSAGASLAKGAPDGKTAQSDVPKDIEGKPVEKKDAKKPESQPGSGSPSAPSAGSPGAEEEKKPPPGEKEGEGINTGVSQAGLHGDMKAAVEYGKALQKAGEKGCSDDGGGATRPSYTGGACMARASGPKNQLQSVSDYKPDDVEKAARRGLDGVPEPPKSDKPITLSFKYDIKKAQDLIGDGHSAQQAALVSGNAYKDALGRSGRAVLEQNELNVGLSRKVVPYVKTELLTGGDANLSALSGQMSGAGTQWDTATALPPAEQTAMKQQAWGTAQGAMGTYSGKTTALVGKGQSLEGEANAVGEKSQAVYASVSKDAQSYDYKYQEDLIVLKSNIAALRGELQRSADAPIGQEDPASAWNLTRGDIEGELSNLQSLADRHAGIRTEYQSRYDSVKAAAKAACQSVEKTCGK